MLSGVIVLALTGVVGQGPLPSPQFQAAPSKSLPSPQGPLLRAPLKSAPAYLEPSYGQESPAPVYGYRSAPRAFYVQADDLPVEPVVGPEPVPVIDGGCGSGGMTLAYSGRFRRPRFAVGAGGGCYGGGVGVGTATTVIQNQRRGILGRLRTRDQTVITTVR